MPRFRILTAALVLLLLPVFAGCSDDQNTKTRDAAMKELVKKKREEVGKKGSPDKGPGSNP